MSVLAEMIQAGLHKFFLLPLPGKVGNVLPAIRLLCRNTYVSLPGFDVDDKDIETQKVQNAVARVRFINEEITSRAQMKQYNCHEGALPFTKSYLLRPLFNAFLMSPKPFHATEACIGCKKCEKVCPVGNITVTDRPVWGGNCTQCLACYHVCPVHAVEYGKMTGKKGQYKGRLLKDL